MEIIVLRNNVIFARARTEDDDVGTFTVMKVADADIPPYPAEAPCAGKTYELTLDGEALVWTTVDCPLTQDERASVIAALTDAQSLEVVALFDPWTLKAYAVGDKVRYSDALYRCVQAHTAQAGWTPGVTPALWTAISVDEYPQWVPPAGAHDAYMIGDKVTYGGVHYISLIDNNTWSPTDYPAGWAVS
jgi:chitodextrinase